MGEIIGNCCDRCQLKDKSNLLPLASFFPVLPIGQDNSALTKDNGEVWERTKIPTTKTTWVVSKSTMESVSDSTDSTSLFSSVYDVTEVPSLGHTMAPEQIPSPDEDLQVCLKALEKE